MNKQIRTLKEILKLSNNCSSSNNNNLNCFVRVVKLIHIILITLWAVMEVDLMEVSHHREIFRIAIVVPMSILFVHILIKEVLIILGTSKLSLILVSQESYLLARNMFSICTGIILAVILHLTTDLQISFLQCVIT